MLRPMVTPAHMALKCPVPHCESQFDTKRAKDCLRVHLKDAKDEDHKYAYNARYFAANATVHICPFCTKTFEKQWRLNRHIQGLHQDDYSKSRCPKCNKILKYSLKEHITRKRCNKQSGSKKSLSTTGKAKQATSQHPHRNTSPPSPDITAQQARQCPVPHCKSQFDTKRAKDCLRVHLKDAKDEDHKYAYNARYFAANTTVHICPFCTKTFEKQWRLNRHIQGLHQDDYSKSRCPKCNKILKYSLKEHITRKRCNEQSGSKISLSITGKAKQATSQHPHRNTSPPSPDITAQQARQPARNEAGLRTHSALRKAPTDDDVGAATSTLSQRTARAALDANHPQPPPMSTINNVQHPSSTVDEAALVYTHHMSPEGCLNSIRHEISLPPTEAGRYVGGEVGVTPQGSPYNSTAPNSAFTSPIRCHPNTGQDVPYNDYTADLRWSGVFGTTWDPPLGQGAPFHKEIVDQQWMESSGPACNSGFPSLLSHDQTVDQQWSGVFGSGWHPYL